MIRYKLTDKDGRTHGDTEWGPGKSYKTNGRGDLCGPGWLHCYNHPLLAVMLNPLHADFKDYRMCEVECGGEEKSNHGLKFGHTKMTFARWIDPPVVTTEQRIAFGILCAKEVYDDKDWNAWANKWLSGEDRSILATTDAARAAAWAADAAAVAAAWAANAWPADARAAAARAAAWAADAAAGRLDLIALAERAAS